MNWSGARCPGELGRALTTCPQGLDPGPGAFSRGEDAGLCGAGAGRYPHSLAPSCLQGPPENTDISVFLFLSFFFWLKGVRAFSINSSRDLSHHSRTLSYVWSLSTKGSWDFIQMGEGAPV